MRGRERVYRGIHRWNSDILCYRRRGERGCKGYHGAILVPRRSTRGVVVPYLDV